MVYFELLWFLTLNLISIEITCDLALRPLWIPVENEYYTAIILRSEVETTTDQQLPKHQFPEEQLASSSELMETDFTITDINELLENSKKNGPLWKSRYDSGPEDIDHKEPSSNNQISNIDDDNRAEPNSNEFEDRVPSDTSINNKISELDDDDDRVKSISNESEKPTSYHHETSDTVDNKVEPISKEQDQGIKSGKPSEKTSKQLDDGWKTKVQDLKALIETIDPNVNASDSNKMSSTERKRYNEEIEAGDFTQLFGVHHIYQPKMYRIKDLGVGYLPQLFRYDKN